MRIVSLTMLYHLADVLELFVQHHLQYVDHMILILHGQSIDGTEEIARRLHREGLPLSIEYSNIPTYEQSAILSAAAARATATHQPDLLLPLDCDEFLCASNGQNVRTLLEQLPEDRITSLPWRTYAPVTQAASIVERMTHRRRAESPQYYKVMIPRRFLQPSLVIQQGSHGVMLHGTAMPSTPSHDLWLAHLPIRSPEQALQKALQSWPRQRDNPHHQPGHGSQWETLYNAAMNGDPFTYDYCIELAASYACPQSGSTPALIRDPLSTYIPHAEGAGR